jgi:hypothetical protein
MIMRVGAAVERVAQKLAEPLREGIRHNPLALDQARIAEGGPLPRRAPIEQHHRTAPFSQLHRDRDADDPGPEHHRVRPHPPSLPPTLRSG